ncbi:hypothetical protein SDJN02_21157, partial [Cucurbita argyrosperma subsp. argyrosperma]
MFLRKKTTINNSDWSERRENVRGRERRRFRRKDETAAAKMCRGAVCSGWKTAPSFDFNPSHRASSCSSFAAGWALFVSFSEGMMNSGPGLISP